MAGNIFSIIEELHYIIQEDTEMQAYHTQILLVNKLDRCQGRGNKYANDHIK